MSSPAILLIQTSLAALVVAAVGCASSEASTPADFVGAHVPIAPLPPPQEEGGTTEPGASLGVSAHVLGSPLCNVSFSTCNPDDPRTARANLCMLAPDGGPYNASAGYDLAQLACHVEFQLFSGSVAPVCTMAGNLNDTSSARCKGSTDCQAGFECVADGSCRRYCCGGECLDPTEFCDIQETAGNSSLSVPVCMPIHGCGLLDQPSDAGSCGPEQTCSVVRVESGATSCVATGGKSVGAECDTDHCQAGLVCLGAAGDRHCYKLCHTAPDSTDCPADRPTCRGGLPLFPTPGVGICQ